jgi:hypothetical protein
MVSTVAWCQVQRRVGRFGVARGETADNPAGEQPSSSVEGIRAERIIREYSSKTHLLGACPV